MLTLLNSIFGENRAHNVVKTVMISICLLLSISASQQGYAVSLTQSSMDPDQNSSRRIISLDQCMDWMLVHYAPKQDVLALSPRYLKNPYPDADTEFSVHNGSLEQIVQLRPTKILVGQFNAFMLRNRLTGLGFDVEVLPLPLSLQALTEYEQAMANALGATSQLTDFPDYSSNNSPPKRLLLLGSNGIGVGLHTLENEIVERSGWQNYLRVSGFINLDLESLILDPPDAILWHSPADPSLANRFAEHPALQLRVVEEAWIQTDAWRWQCPGPWMKELINQLYLARQNVP